MVIPASLKINKLVLLGFRKNYIIPFHPGVNIIYGDADTGKSSILRIVYYLLGSKLPELDVEIASSANRAVLEIEIDSTVYCIHRDLFDGSADVEVFSCPFEEMNENFPTKFGATFAPKGREKKSLSEHLLDLLNFPNIDIKVAPSKDDSQLARLSIRDLFKFCYLNQDVVGSRQILDLNNPSVFVKNKEVFKYIFNVLDGNISALQAQIAEKTQQHNALENKLKVVTEFLEDTQFQSSTRIKEELTKIYGREESLNELLKEVNSRITNDSESYDELKDILDSINLRVRSLEGDKAANLRNIERFTRLRNDYEADIEKLKAILESAQHLHSSEENVANCPVCDSVMKIADIAESFNISEDDKVKQEILALARRHRDLESVIHENRKRVVEASDLLRQLYIERERAKKFVDQEIAETVSPYLQERDALVSEKGALSEVKAKLKHDLKVVNEHTKIAAQISRLKTDIKLLKAKLDKLRETAPSIEKIVDLLGAELRRYLDKIQIKNRSGVSISAKSYLPVVRDIEYPRLNSGGLRTITSIGYVASILKAGLSLNTNLPNILLIDTVGKYLGKTKEKYISDTSVEADVEENVSDPDKYKNIYEYLIELAEAFEAKGKICQIFLVDNDVPEEIAREYAGFVVAHYSSSGRNGLPVGLIDDWDTFKAAQDE